MQEGREDRIVKWMRKRKRKRKNTPRKRERRRGEEKGGRQVCKGSVSQSGSGVYLWIFVVEARGMRMTRMRTRQE